MDYHSHQTGEKKGFHSKSNHRIKAFREIPSEKPLRFNHPET
jgi:hypothetical protein